MQLRISYLKDAQIVKSLKYKDALRAESQYESEADFARGFKTGAMIMLEILIKDST